jgi:predicted NBD/HSP70 family sugar kinase
VRAFDAHHHKQETPMKASKSIHRAGVHTMVSLASDELVIAAGGGEGHSEEIPHQETKTETKTEVQTRPQVQEPAPRPQQPQQTQWRSYGYYVPFCGTYVM